MEIVFSPRSLKDSDYWKKTNNTRVQLRITQLLASILETPFEGIGKPELLRRNLSGYWSRRITQEHRLVYEVDENIIYILSMKDHY